MAYVKTLTDAYHAGVRAPTPTRAQRGPSLYQRGLAASPQPLAVTAIAATKPAVDWAGVAVVGLAVLGGALAVNAIAKSRRPRAVHDRRVREVAEHYLSLGYDVTADLPGWPRPPTMNRHRADVVATRGKKARVVEVEHEHTLTTSHTRRQVQALTEYCDDVTSHRTTMTVVTTSYRRRR